MIVVFTALWTSTVTIGEKYEKELTVNVHSMIKQAFNDSVQILYDCKYMREKYPKKRESLSRLAHAGVGFWWTDVPAFNSYCGLANVQRTMIILPKPFFSYSSGCGSWKSIIGHELLHLVGFPDHKLDKHNKIDETTDEIYITITKCFDKWKKEEWPK